MLVGQNPGGTGAAPQPQSGGNGGYKTGGGYHPPASYGQAPGYQSSSFHPGVFSHYNTSGLSNPGNGQAGGSSGNPWLTDPGYLAAYNAELQGDASIQANLRKLISQALIGYGDPSMAAKMGFNNVAAFARQNYLTGNSTLARLDKSHSQAKTNIVNQLAGRGLLFSGETGYQNGQADQTYGNQVYDAQQALQQAVQGYQQQALDQEMQLRQQVIAALENAYNNYVNSGVPYGSGGGGGGGAGSLIAQALGSGRY